MTLRLILTEDAEKYGRPDGSIDFASYKRDRFALWSRLRRNRRPWVARLQAYARNCFWLPCPICGEPFGGHEKPSGSLEGPLGGGRMVCSDPRCILEAFYRSREVHRAVGPGRDLLVDDDGVTAWALQELGEELRP